MTDHDDRAAQNINPEPPGVSLRPFTETEGRALDRVRDDHSAVERLADRLAHDDECTACDLIDAIEADRAAGWLVEEEVWQRAEELRCEVERLRNERDAWKRTADTRSTTAAAERAERTEAKLAKVREWHDHMHSDYEERGYWLCRHLADDYVVATNLAAELPKLRAVLDGEES